MWESGHWSIVDNKQGEVNELNQRKTERKKVEELLKKVTHVESVPSDSRLPNTCYAIMEL